MPVPRLVVLYAARLISSLGMTMCSNQQTFLKKSYEFHLKTIDSKISPLSRPGLFTLPDGAVGTKYW